MNPSTLFGGTWQAFGQGRTLVSKATSGTFATLGATGGVETRSVSIAAHTHTISHTHSINAHNHTISHTHTINSHSHTINGTAININQMPAHSHLVDRYWSNGSGNKVYANAGFDRGTKYEDYNFSTSTDGGSQAHSHSSNGVSLTTNGASTSNSGSKSLTTNGASTSNSGSGGSQTVSVNVIQPFIVVNMWKRTA